MVVDDDFIDIHDDFADFHLIDFHFVNFHLVDFCFANFNVLPTKLKWSHNKKKEKTYISKVVVITVDKGWGTMARHGGWHKKTIMNRDAHTESGGSE